MSPHVSAAGTDASGNRAAPSPVMLDVEHVAELFDVSTRHIRRLVDEGKFPQPVRLGACVRWNRDTVMGWANDGCPTIRRPAGKVAR